MLKGDLTTTPIVTALGNLASEQATGCLHVVDDDGDEALIYLKSGLVYAVSVPGQRPQLGARLISSNALVPENLAEALEAQRTELQGWRLGELLVHLGFVEQDVVEAFVQEQVRDGFTDLLAWTSGRWRFRKAEKTREDVAPPTPLNQLLDEVRARQSTWEDIVDAVHGPNAVPMLAPHGGEAHITLDPDTWSLLCKIDGERSIADLARECGFTLFEAGAVVRALVEAGLVDVEEDLGPDGTPIDVADEDSNSSDSNSSDSDDDDQSDDAGPAEPVQAAEATSFPRTAALAAAFALGGREPAVKRPERSVEPDRTVEETQSWDVAEAAADPEMSTLAQVSEALTRALGPRQESANSFVDPFHVPDEIRLRPAPKAVQAAASLSEDQLRRERLRQAAAAELAAAHADAEAQHNATKRTSKPGHIAEVVDLEARREAARVEVERRSAERAEADRLTAERAAAAEAERLEAEEAERVAAEEAARLEAEQRDAERLEVEEAARLEAEETARLEAEEAARLAAEEAARIAAEEAAHAATEEAARIAADEAARLEAERLEAERVTAEEAARVAAEEAARAEADRLETERVAAEEAARIAADDAANLAAEEAARLEAERLEAERVAAEEAARVAAEEAARAEAERLEAERLAAEEAARVAAEEAARIEAERIEAERIEAERLAAEEAARIEAERLAAEEAARVEAERLAAEEAARFEAERIEAERLEAERLAEEAARFEAERLAEEAARLEVERLAAEEAARFEVERLAAEEAARLETERLAAEPLNGDWIAAEHDARAQLAAAQAAAEQAAHLEAEQQAHEAAERAEADRIVAVNQMMAQASAPTSDPSQFASANAMLSEFSRTGATTAGSEDTDDAYSDTESSEEGEYESAFHPLAQRDLADTASLLRELSSLGFEDEPPAPSGPRPGGQNPGPSAPRPTTTAANQQKRRRGLFGR